MKRIICLSLLIMSVAQIRAEPKVAVLPFDMLVDSAYGYYDDKISLLNYGAALQEMITTNLSRQIELIVYDVSEIREAMKHVNPGPVIQKHTSPFYAARVGERLGADYVVTGSYGEFSSEIRVDARVVTVATSDVQPGNIAVASVSLWEDLPTAADRISEQVFTILTAGGRVRQVSRGVLFPEGDLDIYDPRMGTDVNVARVIVWVNAPAPALESAPAGKFWRCERIDLMDVPADFQKSHSCRVATLPAGPVEITITHRGYLPYRETLTLAGGKAYRLEVELKEIEYRVR